MKRNWDAFTEFLFQFGFSRAICLVYMCSFTFYSVLSFLISHIVLFFAHLHQFILFFSFPFSFTLSLTFLGRSFVGLVKSKYIKNGNIFNLSFSLFSEFFLCVCFWVVFFSCTDCIAWLLWYHDHSGKELENFSVFLFMQLLYWFLIYSA